MSRNLSNTAQAAINSIETDAVFLVLLTIEHPALAEPLRFVNNLQSIVSNGQVFVAFPFTVELPAETDRGPGEARLVIDNVDRQIVNTIRSISDPASVRFDIIMSDAPDTLEATFEGMILRNVVYDAMQVSGALRFEDVVSEPISLQVTPARLPAVF